MGKLSFKFVDNWPDAKSFAGCIFTNGCFDIIHRGHIELFKFCRLQHTYKQVVVGVNSDESIKELKGPDRPIMSEEDRIAVLLAIQWIDYVIIFDTKSVLPLIEALKPSFLIKGGKLNHICYESKNIEESISFLRKKHGMIPISFEWSASIENCRIGFLAKPNGEVVELIQPFEGFKYFSSINKE